MLSPLARTADGLGVGSTWKEIKEVAGNPEANGSEVEGVTTVDMGSYALQLDMRIWEYELDESKIDPDMPVVAVWVQGN